MRNRAWTQEEIDVLRTGFNAGKLIKIIAGEVGRSTTAVNKFLSRSGIRTRRWSIERVHAPSVKFIEHKVAACTAIGKASSLEKVIIYLQQNGYTVSESPNPTIGGYFLDNKPISSIKLLIIANKLREEQCQPPFSAPELSWE
ncbi:MAG: hypothetical protein IJ599_00130 [Alphaproteobacteria bacterium]|nr:hypothetical protein [Alphaproteobacteria bacterium]